MTITTRRERRDAGKETRTRCRHLEVADLASFGSELPHFGDVAFICTWDDETVLVVTAGLVSSLPVKVE